MNFRPKNGKAQGTGFQIAPMIDVIFLLLCFFVASQVFSQWETEVPITLPTADTGQVPERLPGEIIINIDQHGTIFVNNQKLDDEGLRVLLQRIVKLFPGQPVLIRGDKATDYEHIVRVMDLCRKADVYNISFATLATEE